MPFKTKAQKAAWRRKNRASIYAYTKTWVAKKLALDPDYINRSRREYKKQKPKKKKPCAVCGTQFSGPGQCCGKFCRDARDIARSIARSRPRTLKYPPPWTSKVLLRVCNQLDVNHRVHILDKWDAAANSVARIIRLMQDRRSRRNCRKLRIIVNWADALTLAVYSLNRKKAKYGRINEWQTKACQIANSLKTRQMDPLMIASDRVMSFGYLKRKRTAARIAVKN